jgi:hypothetical protein
VRNRSASLACGVVLTLGMAGAAVAQDKGAEQPPAREQLSVSTRHNQSTRNLRNLRKTWS